MSSRSSSRADPTPRSTARWIRAFELARAAALAAWLGLSVDVCVRFSGAGGASEASWESVQHGPRRRSWVGTQQVAFDAAGQTVDHHAAVGHHGHSAGKADWGFGLGRDGWKVFELVQTGVLVSLT